MVDKTNPTNQFHPYQPQDAVPHSETATPSGLGSILQKVGLDQTKIDAISNQMKNADVRGSIAKARGFARNNSGLVLGGLAALAIGAGLMRRRGLKRA